MKKPPYLNSQRKLDDVVSFPAVKYASSFVIGGFEWIQKRWFQMAVSDGLVTDMVNWQLRNDG